MSFEYCAGTEYGNPVGTNAALKDCLSLYGFNRMFSPILLLPGRENRPGLAFQGDERSGWYYIDVGVWGFSTFGFCSYILENSKLTMLTLNNKKLELTLPDLTSDRVQTYQDASGTIALVEDKYILRTNGEAFTIHPGQPVKIHNATTVKLAQADSESNCCIGIAAATIASGNTGYIVLDGRINISDWTNATGGSSTLTVGDYYWLSQGGAGIITNIGPDGPTGTICQVLGRALTTTELLVRVEQEIIL